MENIKNIRAQYNLRNEMEREFYLMHLSHLRTLRTIRSTDEVLAAAKKYIENNKK